MITTAILNIRNLEPTNMNIFFAKGGFMPIKNQYYARLHLLNTKLSKQSQSILKMRKNTL